MSKLRKWLESRVKKPEARYDETKEEFEKVMGRPAITIKVELPEDLKEFKTEFLSLESNEEFVRTVRELVKTYLKKEQRKRHQVDTSETS